ncbi:unnamed protein product, partial [Discosporangium mesarthrocarpum]
DTDGKEPFLEQSPAEDRRSGKLVDIQAEQCPDEGESSPPPELHPCNNATLAASRGGYRSLSPSWPGMISAPGQKNPDVTHTGNSDSGSHAQQGVPSEGRPLRHGEQGLQGQQGTEMFPETELNSGPRTESLPVGSDLGMYACAKVMNVLAPRIEHLSNEGPAPGPPWAGYGLTDGVMLSTKREAVNAALAAESKGGEGKVLDDFKL